MNKNNSRFYEIDLLRFLAAMAVVMFHYTFRAYIEGGYSSVEYPLIGQFSRYGYLGIHLFFMISGFVILLSAMKRTAPQFAIARFIRLYPAFWAGVSLSALIMYFFGSPIFTVSVSQYLMNMTMVSGYLGVEYIDNVYWTLLVELKFYTLIFLLLLIKRLRQIEFFLAVWLILVLMVTFVPLNTFAPLNNILDFFLFPKWAPYFIAGSLFYLAYSKGFNLSRGIMLLCTYLLAINLVISNLETVLENNYKTDFSSTLPVILITGYYLIFTLIALDKTSWLRSPRLINIGILTYPLYLIHQNIGYIAFNLFDNSVNKYALLVALIAMMLFTAWLIHFFVEKKLGSLLHSKSRYFFNSSLNTKKL